MNSRTNCESNLERLPLSTSSAKPGVGEFDAHLRDIVMGDLENRMEALHCNWKDSGVESDGCIYRSLHQAVRLIKEASPSTITPCQ